MSNGLPRPLRAGHRGGAWKVAYADFVTALMALFIVLWMMGASERVKQSVSGYFRDPRGYTTRLGAGPAHSGEGLKVDRKNVADVRHQLEDALRQAPEFEKIRQHVRFSTTGEGLRIDLLETEAGMFFVSGQPSPTPAGERLLNLLATQVASIPNRVVIEGHTDARPYHSAGAAGGYGNWELSTDRANAARRLLLEYGVRPGQVVEVRGFADERLLNHADPNDARNRRVSLVVKFADGAAE
ncbi:MAG TPA: flagellar motor protein MotB [Candidatus Sulfopaludibacter sp.]|nr:flagellar motor protein MotB [Candidatus Sulfopaludibacter sp.]